MLFVSIWRHVCIIFVLSPLLNHKYNYTTQNVFTHNYGTAAPYTQLLFTQR